MSERISRVHGYVTQPAAHSADEVGEEIELQRREVHHESETSKPPRTQPRTLSLS